MPNELETQFHQMTDDELIDFALDNLGDENQSLRHQALQEHFNRIKEAPTTVVESPGNTQLLDAKLKELYRNT